MELKKPKYKLRPRKSGCGDARRNIWGKPLHAAVHVANWHISDQFIAVKIDRVRVIKSLLAHGADVNGRISMEEPRMVGREVSQAPGRRHRVSAGGQSG